MLMEHGPQYAQNTGDAHRGHQHYDWQQNEIARKTDEHQSPASNEVDDPRNEWQHKHARNQQYHTQLGVQADPFPQTPQRGQPILETEDAISNGLGRALSAVHIS